MCTLARSRRIDPTTKVYELEKERQFWQPSAETRFACCRPDFSQLLMGHREQPIFAIVPNLVLVQLLGQFLELPLPSSRSRNVAALGPSRSSHRIHAEGVSQRSVASRSLRSTSPASAPRAPRRRSLLEIHILILHLELCDPQVVNHQNVPLWARLYQSVFCKKPL